jgi:CubicO group peptidase (beta-lactamase class C family)
MRLVEQGKVDLDADVNQYLKGFQLPNTYQRPITLRQLLERRSGLDDRFIYAPGQIELYSNYGYGAVGAIIEELTGARFEDYLRASVLQPLGMNSSSFQQPLPGSLAAETAPGKWWYQRAVPADGLAVTQKPAYEASAGLSQSRRGRRSRIQNSQRRNARDRHH